MSIKKPYVSLVEFLEANGNKKVSSILEEIKLMCESKKTGSTLIKIDDKVVAIFCYYHKQWEIIEHVPYGSKANTVSGLNTMCKIGTSKWTKAQRDAKKAKESLLDGVSNGDINPADIKSLQEDIEHSRLVIDTTDMPIGYANEEEVMINL